MSIGRDNFVFGRVFFYLTHFPDKRVAELVKAVRTFQVKYIKANRVCCRTNIEICWTLSSYSDSGKTFIIMPVATQKNLKQPLLFQKQWIKVLLDEPIHTRCSGNWQSLMMCLNFVYWGNKKSFCKGYGFIKKQSLWAWGEVYNFFSLRKEG